MFTSSTGQNKGVKALDQTKVDGPINIDMLLSVLSVANSAAKSEPETKIMKIISGFLEAYEIGNSSREAYESMGSGDEKKDKIRANSTVHCIGCHGDIHVTDTSNHYDETTGEKGPFVIKEKSTKKTTNKP